MPLDTLDHEIEQGLARAERMLKRQRMRRLAVGLVMLALVGIGAVWFIPQLQATEVPPTGTVTAVIVTSTATATPTSQPVFTPTIPPTPAPSLTPEVGVLKPITPENVSSLQELNTSPVGGTIKSLAWSPDGGMLAVSTSVQGILLYSLDGLDLLQVGNLTETRSGGNYGKTYNSKLIFSPDGNMLAISLSCEELCTDMVLVYDTRDWKLLYQLLGAYYGFGDIDFSIDSKTLGFIQYNRQDANAVIVDTENWSSKHYGGSRWLLPDISFGANAFVYCGDYTVFIRHRTGDLSVKDWDCSDAKYSPDGEYLAVVVPDEDTLYLDNGNEVQKVVLASLGNYWENHFLIFSPDSSMVWASGWWVDVEAGKPVQEVEQQWSDMAFSPDGTMLATASGSQITLWGIP